MEVIRREAVEYTTKDGKSPFGSWFESLKDRKGKVIIIKRIKRAEQGNFGEWGPAGEGIHEMKIDYGPGYRLYFGLENDALIILLCGGNKSTQSKDIKLAHAYWADRKERRK